MAVMTIGRKALVLTGRRAGKEVTVVKVIDANFVEGEDDKKKVRRYNVRHLEPL